MKYLKRFVYLLYYLKELDYKQARKFLGYAAEHTGRSDMLIIIDAALSVFKYNISIKDYFCFRFFELTEDKRKEWAGTGFMYEYQLRMNPKEVRTLLEDKIRFLNSFRPFIKRKFFTISEIKANEQLMDKLLNNSNGRLVLKGSHGQIGAEVEVIYCKEYNKQTLPQHMTDKKFDLVEDYVVQHPALMELSPSGLNTVRIFTQLHDGKVRFLGARLRISVNSPVDNMAAGNLAAAVDMDTGIVTGPGVYSDITKEDKTIHPVTGKVITGFAIPHWKAVVELVMSAALHTKENRSVGWDIAITADGADLIEGNHNWCKLLWQMPVKMGLKHEIEQYL